MADWNPLLPESWVRAFGLVPVPTFSSARAKSIPGTHAILLDGPLGSFSLSILSGSSQVNPEQAIDWAWSSNVRHAVIVDRATGKATARKWDAPEEVLKGSLETHRSTGELLDRLESVQNLESSQSVIHRALDTFRSIRHEVEKRGGDANDVTHVFNALLEWVSRLKGSDIPKRAAMASVVGNSIANRLRDFPLHSIAEALMEGESDNAFVLDADLLIRHASGTLYQEAHRQLLQKPQIDHQLEMFHLGVIPRGDDKIHGDPPGFVLHTPPVLARAIAEVAIEFIERERGESLDILDPACGSGVFLIECARELHRLRGSGSSELRGFDNSGIAIDMARFCVSHAAGSNHDSLRLQVRDSLDGRGWGNPDIVLMNPPFRAWESLAADERSTVRDSHPTLEAARPDMAFAFLARALESVREGGVVASVVPPSLFDGQAAEPLRDYIANNGQFQVRLIGVFRGFGFYDGPSIEPAFIVVSKSSRKLPVRVVSARDGYQGKALRAMRMIPHGRTSAKYGYEIYNEDQRQLIGLPWTPKPREVRQLVARLTKAVSTTVGDLFVPRLGIRPGLKPAFILTKAEFRMLPLSERQYFRPIADRIQNGRIIHTDYIFYPYSTDGVLLLDSEASVRGSVPSFFRDKLKPNEEALKSRKSLHHRKWWELSEPVATWLPNRKPRLVSQAFGRAGNFAADASARFAVVQGVGWCWINGTIPKKVLYAYLALVNSRVFDRILGCFCPRLHGGQYSLYRKHVERIPLPDLSGFSQLVSLAKIGRAISRGEEVDRTKQERLAREAYRIDGKAKEPERGIKEQFKRLAKQWEIATEFYSFEDEKVQHPLYREIVGLGSAVVETLLLEMRDDPGFWATALAELTGHDPVPEDAESLEEVANAWVKWGRENGFRI